MRITHLLVVEEEEENQDVEENQENLKKEEENQENLKKEEEKPNQKEDKILINILQFHLGNI